MKRTSFFLLPQEEKCEDVTQGYTTEKKCTKWPKQVCKTEKKQVKKFSPETECKKVPRELCGPSGCVLTPGPEECFDKKETVVQEVRIDLRLFHFYSFLVIDSVTILDWFINCIS